MGGLKEWTARWTGERPGKETGRGEVRRAGERWEVREKRDGPGTTLSCHGAFRRMNWLEILDTFTHSAVSRDIFRASPSRVPPMIAEMTM